MRYPVRWLAALFVIAVPELAASEETVVTSCGEVVGRRAVLGADLDCTSHSGFALSLRRGATLSLAGHTLTARDSGIWCDRCRVKGPGTITRPSPAVEPPDSCVGVSAVSNNSGRVSDVSITNFGWGVNSQRSARVERVTVTDSCFGVAAGTAARVSESTITDNTGWGVRSFGRMRVVRSTITGHPHDLWSATLPRVIETTCATSTEDGTPGIDFWGVCGP